MPQKTMHPGMSDRYQDALRKVTQVLFCMFITSENLFN